MKNRFNKKFDYEELDKMDPEVRDLCNAMNSLPGIKTTSSCCGHGFSNFEILFRVIGSNKEGLFFLTRCVDRRYWEYGYLWKIELSVGDSNYVDFNKEESDELPIFYSLNSGPIVGEDAYKQAKSLLKNMDDHINHLGFMKGYNINIKNFILT